MQFSSQNVKIIAAVVIAGAMIGTSFWLTRSQTNIASALSTDELLRAYVAQDTDDDGLPDWKEQAYGTDPENPSSVQEGLTDLEALNQGYIAPVFSPEEASEPYIPFIPVEEPAPSTLTARFSTQFAQAFFAAGSTMTEEKQQALIDGLLTTFVTEAAKKTESSYSLVSVRTSRNVTTEEYAQNLLGIFTRHDVPEGTPDLSELAQRFIEREDGSSQDTIRVVHESYVKISEELLATSAPTQLASAHLTLLRSFDSLARISELLRNYKEDPIAALGATSMITPSSEGILVAFKTISGVILSDGEPAHDSAAAYIVRVSRTAEQQP